MRYCIYTIIFLLLIYITAFSQDAIIEKGTISVIIENIKNDKGQIRACLFNKKEGFPDKPEKAYKIIKKDISKKNNMIIEFNRLYYQEYAIAVLHDEDGNNKMKTGIFGIPQEDCGVSNNVKGQFGPPKFKDAKIKLNSKNISIKIRMNY